MTEINRVAFVGNSLPRRCGIATFTTDLQQAVAASRPRVDTCIVAMNNDGQRYDYPPTVRIQIDDDRLEDYVHAAGVLNTGGFDAVSLQLECGIFGGEAGGHVLALVSRLNIPVITTLHTVLARPSPIQRSVFGRLVNASSRVVVMAEKGRELLQTVYQVPREKIEFIPHGIPNVAFAEPDQAKARLGFAGRPVILTFGLLSPNKGIEVMIDAMPAILQTRPDAIYVVLGATHPNLVRDEGEAYRERLMQRTRDRGVDDNVVFLDQFVDRPTLLDFISMCDVYVTPYLTEAQMTSGTLAYSFGLGKAVVSTPYWHARELLADGRGILVPFSDAQSTGQAVAGLLSDDIRRQAMREAAYQTSRSMTWERTAENYLSVFDQAHRGHRFRVISGSVQALPSREPRPPAQPLPELRFGHLLSMCDDTGMLQHAVHSVADRSHGYCVDDNARALLLACALGSTQEPNLPEPLSARLAAFIQHAWNPDTKRFRNFMSFDRRWLEDRGSEDSHGRTLWALGECARGDMSAPRRQWAASLFAEALPTTQSFTSPRAWAFTLLGLHAYRSAVGGNMQANRMRHILAGRLMTILAETATEDWGWFEAGLSYDNARLCQALIATGVSTGTRAYQDAGLRSLRWLMGKQTTSTGLFRPVGTDGFGELRMAPRAFDQQPLEAAATISACLAAWTATGDPAWNVDAERALAWFHGVNDLGVSLVDADTGGCRDGLHSDRPNENRGAESVLSYLLGLAEMRQLARTDRAQATLEPVLSLRA